MPQLPAVIKHEAPAMDLTSNELEELKNLAFAAFNESMTSQRRIGGGNGVNTGTRDLDAECHYPDTEHVTMKDWLAPLYKREPINRRIVEVLPRESWQAVPKLVEDDAADNNTEFEKSWREVGMALNFGSHLKDEEAHPIWKTLLEIDILSGIGHYGVLFLGIDDGEDWAEPVSVKKENRLLFIKPLAEDQAEINMVDKEEKSERYGLPTSYNIHFQDESVSTTSGVQTHAVIKTVHWTRVIHIADNKGSSRLIGTPRQIPVLNRLLDLRKLYGGSAEMYWKGAFPGLAFETQPQLAVNMKHDLPAMREGIQKYFEGLQRYVAPIGMNTKSLSPQVVSPKDQIETQLEAICIQIATPKRIFMGSERGELASGQDDQTWNDRLKSRQTYYLTPDVIAPVVDRFILLGILPIPETGYKVVWPDLNTQSETEKSTVALTLTDALVKYIQGGVNLLVPPIEFLTKILKLPVEVSEAILEKADLESLDDFGEEEEEKPTEKPTETPTEKPTEEKEE